MKNSFPGVEDSAPASGSSAASGCDFPRREESADRNPSRMTILRFARNGAVKQAARREASDIPLASISVVFISAVTESPSLARNC